MKQVPNFGDERQMLSCVYCGNTPTTRDHVPPRVLLDEPYPENLHVVPACLACNSTVSLHEEFIACLIECTLTGSTDPPKMNRPNVQRILSERPAIAADLEAARIQTADGVSFQIDTERVGELVLKLARGHAAFDLNEPQFRDPLSLSFEPLATLDGERRARFETPPHSDVWAEVGSRAMQQQAETGGIGWTVVQQDRYRYLAVGSRNVTIRVVLSEYLACEVIW